MSRSYSLIDIFKVYQTDNNRKIQKIVIPMIQRDYAQGREDKEIEKVRNRFLESLKNAIIEKPIILDFVYGDINADGIMTPLDGQQRLTTLFLLHWYAVKKDCVTEKEYEFLNNFSYETRFSAREFCNKLIPFNPLFTETTKISDEIRDQSWFPLDWNKDPTIRSMLVMLDAIDDKFKDVADILWKRLNGNAITFYFLPIDDMGLTDELYIKMNSRGKLLTEFEHFKAELQRELKKINEDLACDVIKSIDNDWTDLLWNYRNSGSGNYEDNIIDDEFLRYFKFICDIICYRHGDAPQDSNDVFDLIQKYFTKECEDAVANIKTLQDFFNCWCEIDDYPDPTSFLNSFISENYERNKIVADKGHTDIFSDCVHSYSEKNGNVRKFPLNRMVLLYAIVVYLQNKDKIARADFNRRIRIVNNLIQNSEEELSIRTERNSLPAIIKQVDSIILNGIIINNIGVNFNANQLAEEKAKMDFLNKNLEYAEKLFELEDHKLLYGQTGIIIYEKDEIISAENLELTTPFISLFKCDWDKVDCALMALGNYGQRERNKWRYQYGSAKWPSAWESLFHKSSNDNYDNTRHVLRELLKINDNFTNEILDKIIFDFIYKHEEENSYTWEYYYVKYKSFRPGSYGKIYKSVDNPTYTCLVMKSQKNISTTTYNPYFKEADETHLDSSAYGQRLKYEDKYIRCTNNLYEICAIDGESNDIVIKTEEISQNSEGIDIEDRIIKLKHIISDLGYVN